MCIGFDQKEKLALGTIPMEITVSPLTSITSVIIMKEEVLEPLILGRSWLAEVGAVASSVHQMLKFKYQGKVVSILANRPGILYTFKMPEPQIATLWEEEESQRLPWRKSPFWDPKPLLPPVSSIFRAARPP